MEENQTQISQDRFGLFGLGVLDETSTEAQLEGKYEWKNAPVVDYCNDFEFDAFRLR